MNVEIRVGHGNLVLEAWSAESMAAVAQVCAEAIRSRTQGGVGADGKVFPRGARGKFIRLYRTGYMLGSTDVKRYDENGATVGTDASYAGDVSNMGPGRYPFMGVDRETEMAIAKAIGEAVNVALMASAASSATKAALSGLF